jgi:hypothetical protein
MMAKRAAVEKAALYFDVQPGSEIAVIETRARDTALRNQTKLSGDVDQRLAIRVSDGMNLPHQIVMKSSPKPFDFAYQLSSSDVKVLPAMVDAIRSMATELGDAVNHSTAAVLVGKEIAITTGDGPIYNIMPLRRVPTMDHAEFMHHWFDRHASLGEGVAGVRYRQNHIDSEQTQALAAKLGLSFVPMDGLTESFFDDLEAARAILSQEDVAVGAIDDEKRFIDHSRSQFAIYKTVWRSKRTD